MKTMEQQKKEYYEKVEKARKIFIKTEECNNIVSEFEEKKKEGFVAQLICTTFLPPVDSEDRKLKLIEVMYLKFIPDREYYEKLAEKLRKKKFRSLYIIQSIANQ